MFRIEENRGLWNIYPLYGNFAFPVRNVIQLIYSLDALRWSNIHSLANFSKKVFPSQIGTSTHVFLGRSYGFHHASSCLVSLTTNSLLSPARFSFSCGSSLRL